MTGDLVNITVPCDLWYRNPVGALIGAVCRQLENQGADRGIEVHVTSAFNEAFNNLALHASNAPGPVKVELEVTEDQLILHLKDTGKTFDFDAVLEPDLLKLPESGLGLFIIRSFMNEVQYRPGDEDGENVLRMVKWLRAGTPDNLAGAFEEPNDDA